MEPFPPPNPHDVVRKTDSGPSSWRTGTVVILTSALLVGGVVVGSQFASANAPSLMAAPTTPAATSATTSAATSAAAPATTPAVDDEPTTTDADVDDHLEERDDAVPGHDDGLPGDIAEHIAAFEEFNDCIGEHLGDVLGDIGDIGDIVDPFFGLDEQFGEYHGSVVIDIPDPTGADWSSYDFGEGDGAITITKIDGTVEVAVNGDVAEFDAMEHDAQFDEFDAHWETASEACADLLPDDMISFDDFGEFGVEFGEFGDEIGTLFGDEFSVFSGEFGHVVEVGD